MSDVLSRIVAAAATLLDGEPTVIVRAPGRVNLIGEHTDYNDGFVLPMAIDRAVWIALRPREDRRVVAHALDFGERCGFSLDGLERGTGGWDEYLRGVAWALGEEGRPLRGWEGVIAGDVPLGAGLSSSAALELAVARAFSVVSDIPWDPASMALAGQKAENGWVGVNCGIMDQLISAAGQAGHALLIDCRSLERTAVPLPAGMTILVLDTGTRRGLVDSAYNERRSQCEAAARAFGVPALRDVTAADLEAGAGRLSDLELRRARHVVTENLRTEQAAEAMRQGDADALGRLMDASHASLRDDFEVSSSALDAMVDCARRSEGCLGARMTGAGFGGCAVALVRRDRAEEVAAETEAAYRAATANNPAIYVCRATDGASVEP